MSAELDTAIRCPLLTSIRLTNFKIYGDPGVFARFAPVTMLLGPNSGGKSTLLQAVQVLQQTWASGDYWTLQVEGSQARLGSFGNVVHGHETSRRVTIDVEFSAVGGASLGVAVDAREGRVERYFLRPRKTDVPTGFERGVRVTEGHPLSTAEAGRGVWFELDATSLGAWYGNEGVAADITWWRQHEERIKVLVHLTRRELCVEVLVQPANFLEEPFIPEPRSVPNAGRARWAENCLARPALPPSPVGAIRSEDLEWWIEDAQARAEIAWQSELTRRWPTELELQWQERADEGAARARWVRAAEEAGTALGVDGWTVEWNARLRDFDDWAPTLTDQLRRDTVSRETWARQQAEARTSWQREEDRFQNEASDWKSRANQGGGSGKSIGGYEPVPETDSTHAATLSTHSPTSRLWKILVAPVNDVLEAAVVQTERLRFVGGIRSPGDRWTELDGRPADSVGADGAALAAVLSNPQSAICEQLNRALGAVGVGYQVSPVRTSDGHDRVPPAVYLKLCQVNPVVAEVGLRDVGSGIRQMLPVLTEFESLVDRHGLRVGSTLFIEQPELHLHPRLQGDLMSWLAGFETDVPPGGSSGGGPRRMADWAPREGAPQVVIETHGEVMVRRLGRMVRAGRLGKGDVALLVVHRALGAPGCASIDEAGLLASGEIDWSVDDVGFFDERYGELDE